MFRQDWLGHLGGEGERTSTNVAIPKPIGFDDIGISLLGRLPFHFGTPEAFLQGGAYGQMQNFVELINMFPFCCHSFSSPSEDVNDKIG